MENVIRTIVFTTKRKVAEDYLDEIYKYHKFETLYVKNENELRLLIMYRDDFWNEYIFADPSINSKGIRPDKVVIDRCNITMQQYEDIIKPMIVSCKFYDIKYIDN